MGWFDFIKGAGQKLLGEDNKAESVKHLLKETFGDHISSLKVTAENDEIVLVGVCDSAATKEKAILLAGNIEGVAKVNDDQFLAPEPVEKITFYTVAKGDSLSKIALHFYGKATLYTKIFEANREVVKDPNLIYPGQKIRIPELKN